jgi:hypothetical protein
MFLKNRNNLISKIFKQNFSTSSILFRRPPPKEEFENNSLNKRKKTAEPFDRLVLFIKFLINFILNK